MRRSRRSLPPTAAHPFDATLLSRRLLCTPPLPLFRSKEKLKWEKVGRLESDLCVHDMVSVGDGKQTVLFPAEQEKLLESLMAQVSVHPP